MNAKQNWLQPAVVGGTKGCLCCGAMHASLPGDAIVAVGFGSAFCSKGREVVYDEREMQEGEDYKTCADMEVLAAIDPDHDWQINFFAPLYEAVYQRHGPNHWVLIKKGMGFA